MSTFKCVFDIELNIMFFKIHAEKMYEVFRDIQDMYVRLVSMLVNECEIIKILSGLFLKMLTLFTKYSTLFQIVLIIEIFKNKIILLYLDS